MATGISKAKARQNSKTKARASRAKLGLVAKAGASLLMVTHSERLAGRLDRRLHLAAGRVSG